MSGCAHKCQASLLLCLPERRRDFFKNGEVLVNVGFRVLNGDGPLLVPPIGLREYAAIDHGEPVVPPEIDVDLGPVAVVLNLLRIEHQGAVDAGAGDVGLQAGFLDDGAIAFGEIFAELADVRIILARSEEHTSELQSLAYLVCRLLLEKKINYELNSFTAHYSM